MRADGSTQSYPSHSSSTIFHYSSISTLCSSIIKILPVFFKHAVISLSHLDHCKYSSLNLEYLPWTHIFIRSFPGGSNGKEFACNSGDLDLIPGLGRFPGEGNGYPLQYSCLENPMNKGTWWAIVHVVTKIHTWLSDWHFYIFIIPW